MSEQYVLLPSVLLTLTRKNDVTGGGRRREVGFRREGGSKDERRGG